MKRLAFLFCGCFPLVLGYLLNYLIMSNYVPPLFLIGIAILIVWFLVGMFSAKFIEHKTEIILLLNAPAFLFLLLGLLQEIVLGQYWLNQVGLATQLYYLPLLNFTATLLQIVINHFYLSYGYVLSFSLLLISSYCGRVIAQRRA